MSQPSSQTSIPKSYLCCITHQLMQNPVMDREGNTYEESAILQWLRNNSSSPITRNYLDTTHLTINRAVKDAIQEYTNPIPQSGSSITVSTNAELPVKIKAHLLNIFCIFL